VPLVLLERSQWAGFNGIYLVRFGFRMWDDFEVISAAENSNKYPKISWGHGNTWANSSGHTSFHERTGLKKIGNFLAGYLIISNFWEPWLHNNLKCFFIRGYGQHYFLGANFCILEKAKKCLTNGIYIFGLSKICLKSLGCYHVAMVIGHPLNQRFGFGIIYPNYTKKIAPICNLPSPPPPSSMPSLHLCKQWRTFCRL